jgi:hypothetical protein
MTTIDLMQLARAARNRSAQLYRRARKCERDGREWDTQATRADENAAWYERHAADPDDPEFAQVCRDRAPEQRTLAGQCRTYAQHQRDWAPRWRKLAADAAAQARRFEATATEGNE